MLAGWCCWELWRAARPSATRGPAPRAALRGMAAIWAGRLPAVVKAATALGEATSVSAAMVRALVRTAIPWEAPVEIQGAPNAEVDPAAKAAQAAGPRWTRS